MILSVCLFVCFRERPFLIKIKTSQTATYVNARGSWMLHHVMYHQVNQKELAVL